MERERECVLYSLGFSFQEDVYIGLSGFDLEFLRLRVTWDNMVLV